MTVLNVNVDIEAYVLFFLGLSDAQLMMLEILDLLLE